MGCLAIILIFLLIVWVNESPGTFVIGLFITAALITWAVISQSSKEIKEKEKKNLKDEYDKKSFEDKKQEYNINGDNLIVNYIRGFAKIAKTKYYIWVDKESICLFPAIPQSNEQDYLVYKIPLENFINYFDDGVKHSMFFDYEDYMTLLKIMPEKEYSNVVKSNLLRGSKSSTIEQIKELGELKEKGILTKEEFNEKKKLLLDKIK